MGSFLVEKVTFRQECVLIKLLNILISHYES